MLYFNFLLHVRVSTLSRNWVKESRPAAASPLSLRSPPPLFPSFSSEGVLCSRGRRWLSLAYGLSYSTFLHDYTHEYKDERRKREVLRSRRVYLRIYILRIVFERPATAVNYS